MEELARKNKAAAIRAAFAPEPEPEHEPEPEPEPA